MTEAKKTTPSEIKEPISKDLEEFSSVPDGEDSIFKNSSPRSREIMRRAVMEKFLEDRKLKLLNNNQETSAIREHEAETPEDNLRSAQLRVEKICQQTANAKGDALLSNLFNIKPLPIVNEPPPTNSQETSMTPNWDEETGTPEDNLKVGQLRLARYQHQSEQFREQSKESLSKKQANQYFESKDFKDDGATNAGDR